MLQKQKTGGEAPDDKKEPKISDDHGLKQKADKAKDILAKLDAQMQKPKGHWEICCGVRRWVED